MATAPIRRGCSRRGNHRLNQTGRDVVDTPGDADPRRDGRCAAEKVDVSRDRGGRIDDRGSVESRLVDADELGVAASEAIVSERARSTLGVMDHGHLEQRALGHGHRGELAN
jgi:hypothetical protein